MHWKRAKMAAGGLLSCAEALAWREAGGRLGFGRDALLARMLRLAAGAGDWLLQLYPYAR